MTTSSRRQGRAIARRMAFSLGSFVALALITLTPTPRAGAQNGLLGEYFDNQNFTGTRVTRLDPVINFDWGNGSPIPGIDLDTFTVRWTGEIVPRYSETYTFSVRSDDGERLWVNGQLICNGWTARLATTDSGTIPLQAGERYVIQLEFFDQTAGAVVSLAWSSPSQPYEIIPASQLFPPVPGANRPPNSPLIIAPQAENMAVDPGQFTPRTDVLSDPDTGNTHGCTEWEIWTVSPSERVWAAGCTNGLRLRSVALREGAFENSHAGRTSLQYFEQYLLRVRFKDSSGVPATEWSRWSERRFQTTPPLTTIVPDRAVWRYRDDAVDLGTAWRGTNYNDAGWSLGAAQIGFGDQDEATTCCNARPTTAYFRRTFVHTNVAALTNAIVRLLRDDGGIVYVNGVEVFRSNLPGGTIGYATLTPASVPEADESYFFYSGTFNPGLLRNGTNVVAVEIHQSSLTSSDLSFDLELLGVYSPEAVSPAPRILGVTPPGGEQFALTNLTVVFSEPVTGVDAEDLLINGVGANEVTGGSSNTVYTFVFAQPADGPVSVTWAASHGIIDFDTPPHEFNAGAPGAVFLYTLLNPNAPAILSQSPSAGATVSHLTQVSVTFSKSAAGVDADDLLVNGMAATTVTGSDSTYTFVFPPPPDGAVLITWATNHDISDASNPANLFEPGRSGNTWAYTLVDQTPPNVAAQAPPAGATVTNLTQLTVAFSESVTGVNASDLLVNGTPASTVTGSNAAYMFTFPQPNSARITLTWSVNHGIKDAAGNAFSGAAPGAAWDYATIDNIAPAVASIFPPPHATVRGLTEVTVRFAEPVTGLDAADLVVNGVPGQNVRGSGSGPYTFLLVQPATGTVSIAWRSAHGITDLAAPPNAFAGGAWNYTLDPDAVLAGTVLFEEIMFQPASKQTNDEWLEIVNRSPAAVNLNGWRITGGVEFTFPDVTLPAGERLVIAASVVAFRSRYPGVTNLIGGWGGDLGNNDQSVRLETALGEEVNSVHYASEGDWAVRARGPLSRNHRGWIWSNQADGLGSSLELRNPGLPNQHGRNWSGSAALGGTPGRPNSVAATNIAPLILNLRHTPTVPRSPDPVVISATILDEQTSGAVVMLFYRHAATLSPGAFTPAPMFDDGAHQDGLAGDNLYAGTIPPQTNDAVIEFYVQAVDEQNQTNTCPAPALDESGGHGQFANALYQVDDRSYGFAQPLYKLILTEAERQERETIASVDPQSDAELNATLITIDGTGIEVRYNCGVRERGAGSRGYVPANQRVNVPTDRRWKAQREFNLNTRYTHAQYAGYLLATRSGLDTENARIVRVRLNNRDQANAGPPQYGCYIHVEAPNADMAQDHFPLDDKGNLYRASSTGHSATLAYLGTNGASYASAGYSKVSNSSENDWRDLADLTYALSPNTSDSNYTAAVRAALNVDQWMLYFAVNALLVNMETSLGIGNGDDYGLYRGVTAPRFLLIAHDWDTVLNQGDTGGSTTASLFRMTSLASMNRFVNRPEFTASYYDTLRRLCLTSFSPREVAKTLDEGLGSFVPQNVINSMKTFASNRVLYVLAQLPPDATAPGVAPRSFGGAVTSDLVLAAANSPYTITSAVTVASSVTLTIQPGTAVRFENAAGLTVAAGGRLLAEGTAGSPILFTRSGASGNWGNLTIQGAPGSPESRIGYAHFEFNAANAGTPAILVSAGTISLDHLTFGNTAAPCLHLDAASFVVSHCEFPSATASFEPVHGAGGIKEGGRGLFYRNWFGTPIGFNDVVDFTGGNRPGQPLVHFLDNVFIGATDDILDLDGTDAWIEGNIFLHAHRNGSPDSASAISGGRDSTRTSELTVLGNIFYDCDQAANAKEGNFYVFFNNTIVRTTRHGGADTSSAVIRMADEGTAEGAGAYFEGNIISDAELLVAGRTNAIVTFTNNILHAVSGPDWSGPGGNNNQNDPLFVHGPGVAETLSFTNWAAAQVLREWLSLQPGSPAAGTGPNGADQGAVVPSGVMLSVQADAMPDDALLKVGVNRTGHGIPASSWFNGSGYTHYRWRIDGGAWSSETPLGSPATLPGFHRGLHRVDVAGRRDTGSYQDDDAYGPSASVISVFSQPTHAVQINEVLASNESAANHFGKYPDMIELHNTAPRSVDISGMRLTDDPADPNKFTFPQGTRIPADGYLVVLADNDDDTPGFHAGFPLSKDGQTVQLYSSVAEGGALADAVTFGLQLTDYSIGRVGASWTLATPTLGGRNVPARTGDPAGLVINEILAAERNAFSDDFVEIHNPQQLPVALGGLFLTDNPSHWPGRSPVPALTFIGANGDLAFRADGEPDQGADHLSFSLAAERGIVALLNVDYSLIDCFVYGPQSTDISQGRSPGNDATTNLFNVPTPGAPNPSAAITNQGVVLNEILAANATIRELDGATPDWVELFNNSSNAVDLAGYSLSETPLTPRQYVFLAGTILPARGYLRLRCDGSQFASITNTGFNLKAEGGALYLFNPPSNGGGLLNAVTYGLQAVDFSIGRVPDGTGPFALNVPTPEGGNIAATLASPASIRINEWMAADPAGEDWFELWNPNPQPVAIGGYHLTDDLNNRTKSPIRALSFLGASTNGYQRFWADNNPAAGADHTDFKLNDSGESIAFVDPGGVLLDSITFGAQPSGVAEGRFPDGATTPARFPNSASPGEANYLALTSVAINEALTHTDPPLEDAIELHNLTTAPVNVGGWWLSDARTRPRKYRLPDDTMIPAGGYVVFYENQFNAGTGDNPNAFALSSARGDEVYLFTASPDGALTGYRAAVKFGAAPSGVSLGRYVTSDGREEFVAMSTRSLGQDDPVAVEQFRAGTGLPNAYPLVGPVVIAQLMYHPGDSGGADNTLDEFIELRNLTAGAQALYDPLHPTNTWRLRDAVDYDFPPGVSLPAGGRLLLVSFDPLNNPAQFAVFRSKYGVEAGAAVYGPYAGKLKNSEANVELYRPDDPDAGFVPYVLSDRLHYHDAAPWPAAADGFGSALRRVSLTGFGNDPTNWVASVPNFSSGADPDGDGMPNWWETLYGFDGDNPADASQDADGDGLVNLAEYRAGTDPRDPFNLLRLAAAIAASAVTNTVELQFTAVANQSYTIEYRDSPGPGPWLKLADIPAVATTREVRITYPLDAGTTQRFYRLRTPRRE